MITFQQYSDNFKKAHESRKSSFHVQPDSMLNEGSDHATHGIICRLLQPICVEMLQIQIYKTFVNVVRGFQFARWKAQTQIIKDQKHFKW